MKNSRIALAVLALAALAATGFSTAKSQSAAPTAKDCCTADAACCTTGGSCCDK